MFKNREEAGKKLGEKLGKYSDPNSIVVALPRGGVVIGHEVSKALGIPLDILAGRKGSKKNMI